jgi:hypothetical protein
MWAFSSSMVWRGCANTFSLRYPPIRCSLESLGQANAMAMTSQNWEVMQLGNNLITIT